MADMVYVVVPPSAQEEHVKQAFPDNGIPRQYRRHPKGIPSNSTILLCGDHHRFLLGHEGISDKANLSRLRGKLHPFYGHRVLVTFNPAILAFDTTKLVDLHWDFLLACRAFKHGSIAPVVGDYEWVEKFDDGMEGRITLDLETLGLDQFAKDARIISVSLTRGAGKSQVYKVPPEGPSDEVQAQIAHVCNSNRIKLQGANLKFDALWLKEHWGIEVTNLAIDTTLIGSLLDENRSNSLENHTKYFVPDLGGYDSIMNTKYDKGRMDLVPDDDLLTYAGGDTDACHRVADVFRGELLKPANHKIANLYVHLVRPVANAFVQLEHRGVVVDQKKYDEVESIIGKDLGKAKKVLEEVISDKVREKYKDDFKFSRSIIIKDFLFTKNGLNLKPLAFTEKAKGRTWKDAALDKSAILMLAEEYSGKKEVDDFLDAYKEYVKLSKYLSTYCVGFRKHIRLTGKLHPDYRLYKADDGGTLTGRLSAKDPAYQTIPKHGPYAKILRTPFVPPPGHSILKCDFSQGELRITADVSQDPTMRGAYLKGEDIHRLTAARNLKLSIAQFMQLSKDDQDKYRFHAKGVNFGFVYGMAAPGFVAYMRDTFGVTLTVAEANNYRDSFFRTYGQLFKWHNRYRGLAKKYGYVETPMGRRRRLPLINSKDSSVSSKQERMAVNSPIQGCLSDMTLLAMSELYKRWPTLWVFGNTHDEIQMYVPAGDELLWAKRVKDVMENLPLDVFGWSPSVPIIADAEASHISLADCEELDCG